MDVFEIYMDRFHFLTILAYLNPMGHMRYPQHSINKIAVDTGWIFRIFSLTESKSNTRVNVENKKHEENEVAIILSTIS